MWVHLKAHVSRISFTHSLRLLPHYHNTGGFFIALLKKTGPVPSELPEVASHQRRTDLLDKLLSEGQVEQPVLDTFADSVKEEGEKLKAKAAAGVSAKDLSFIPGRHQLIK